MIRGLFLAAAVFLLTHQSAPGAEPEKVRFKQSGTQPRELPGKKPSTVSTQSQDIVAFESYRETLKAWYSAKKRLHALEAVNKILQNDASSDKQVVVMIELMATEKRQEVESLRTQLASILSGDKLEDPKLPPSDREEILVREK
ncbi:MAG: hypothetical protein ACOYMS_06770 [Terrimicrobiaceae bacterium]